MEGTYDFIVYQGELVEKTLIWEDVNKGRYDLTDYSALFHIYNPKTLATILDLIDTGDSPGLVLGGEEGTIALTITIAQTTLFTFDFASYYLKMTDGLAVPRFIIRGVITNIRT